MMNNKAKEKLVAMRTLKGFTQKEVADRLHLEVSGYSRRESGDTKMRIDQWVEVAKMFNVPLNIYEEDEKQSITFNNNATGTYSANYLYTNVHEALIETQKKYIQKLEEENAELKQRLIRK